MSIILKKLRNKYLSENLWNSDKIWLRLLLAQLWESSRYEIIEFHSDYNNYENDVSKSEVFFQYYDLNKIIFFSSF